MGSLLKFLIVSVFLFSLVSVPLISAANGDAAPPEVAEAEAALVSAHGAVLAAEAAGADVSVLLDKLNAGSEYLAEANTYVRLGDSENATHFASLCVEAVGDVEDEAVKLRNEAVKLRDADSFAVIIESAVGVVCVAVAAFVVWRVFKQHYLKGVRD
jgi:hypothetical protein